MVESIYDGEINMILPLFFGILVFCFVAVISLIVWILHKTKAADFSEKSHGFGVFRSVILTIVGFFIFSVVSGGIITFIEIIGNSFLKLKSRFANQETFATENTEI